MTLIDLHVHSSFSDGLPAPRDIEAHCQRQQIGAVVTDHNEIRGSVELVDRGQIPTVPAIEVGTREGLEFLVYFDQPELLEEFYVRAVEPYLLSRFMVRSRIEAVACLDCATELGAYVSLAHPYAFGRKSLNYHKVADGRYKTFVHDVFERIDAVEHFNGGIPKKANMLAESLHLDLEKQVTVGTDSHRLSTIGSAGMTFDLPYDAQGDTLFSRLTDAAHQRFHAGVHSSVMLTVPIIMFKHTVFFLLRGNAKRSTGEDEGSELFRGERAASPTAV